jgi:nucleotide-binding universal stress UspA family protein
MYKKILIPVDLADDSSWQNALPAAVKFARLFDASILVATVVRDVRAYWETGYMPDAYEALFSRSEQKLATIVNAEIPSGVSVETKVAHGSIHREILRIAQDEQVDLIIMASHSPGVLDYLLGPNAAHVVRHARCSVLVVRGERVE